MVVVVIPPAEHHQAFRLGIPNEGNVLQQFLSVAADALKESRKKKFGPEYNKQVVPNQLGKSSTEQGTLSDSAA